MKLSKKHLLLTSILSLSTAMYGCGGGDDNNTGQLEPPKDKTEQSSLPDEVFGRPDEQEAKTRDVTFSITTKLLGFVKDKSTVVNRYSCKRYGGDRDCNPDRIGFTGQFPDNFLEIMAGKAHPDPATMPPPPDDVFNGTVDLYEYDYLLDHVELDLQKEGYKESIRPDVFNDGYASILDVVLVAAKKYNLDVKYHYDEELKTYWIDSINGIDGMQPEWLPNNDDMIVPYGECTGPGGWKALHGNGQYDVEGGIGAGGPELFHRLEEVYQRLGEYYVQSQSGVVLVPACKEEKELREEIYRKELARQAANGGKVIIPEVIVNFEWNKKAYFKDIEVKAHNLRSDIFKPGVLTHMDLVLALKDHSKSLDVGINVWPKMSSGITINGYHLNYLSMDGVDDKGQFFQEGHDADGTSGWNYHAGEWERVNDAAYGMISTFKWAFCGMEFSGKDQHQINQSIRFTMPGSPCTGGDWRPGSGTWQTPTPDELSPDGDPKKGPIHMGMTPYYWGTKTPYAPLGTYTNSKDGITRNRSYFPHSFSGNALHVMPDVVVMHNTEYFEFFQDAFFGGSEKYMREQVKIGEAIAVPYTYDIIPPELDYTPKDITKASYPLSESHFGWKQPNCKTCHKDGANNNHIAEDMKPFECAECHANNGAPKGHGEQATCGFCHAATLPLHGNAYQEVDIPEGAWNPVTDPLAVLGNQKHAAEWWGLYTDFPEPSSCLTCHPSENHRLLKK